MKLNDFRAILKEKGVDFALFYTSDSSRANPSMFYFTGYRGIGALVVPSKKEPFILAPEMEFRRAKKSHVSKVYSMKKKRFFESVSHTIMKNRISQKKIAIDNNNFTLNSYKAFRKNFRKAKIRDISMECLKIRETKTQHEIGLLKKSCRFADTILQKAIKNLKSFRTEPEADAFLQYEAKRLGLELSFDPIVASGVNASMPHHIPSDKLKKGFCVLDFGVKYKGYCSDITRTVCIGNPSKKEKEFYNLLLSIQKDTISQIKPNKKCHELYDFVNRRLGRYKDYFTHGLGHGVGIEIHEMPNLALNSNDRIANDMVFTVEPGIYIPGKFGIRIEDTILFKGKPVILTNTSKDLLII